MAKMTGADLTYTRKGIREQLADAIYTISPEDTVFLSMIGRDTAKNTLFDWQTDSLRAPVTTNQKVESNVPTFTGSTPTTRLGNYCEIAEELASVSGTAEAVTMAGRRSEMAYQLSKGAPQLKLDMESSLLANKGANGGGDATPRQTAALPSWIYSNTSKGTGGFDPSYTNIPQAGRIDGTARTFLESHLTAVMETGYTVGSKYKVLMVGAFNKGVVSQTFTGVASHVVSATDVTASRQYNQGANGRTPWSVVASVDVYVGDFHTVRVVPNRLQRPQDAFLLDPEFLAVAYLRSFERQKLGPIGDGQQEVLRAEYGLKVKNEKALAGIYDLTTS